MNLPSTPNRFPSPIPPGYFAARFATPAGHAELIAPASTGTMLLVGVGIGALLVLAFRR